MLLLTACAHLAGERTPVVFELETLPEAETHELVIQIPTNTAVVPQTGALASTTSPSPVATSTSLPSPSLTPTSTATSTPTSTPQPSATPTDTALPTKQPTETLIPQPGIITGQILLRGMPLTQTVTIILEDQNFQAVRELSTENGFYRFDNLAASADGYNVLFAQARNPQFAIDEVVSWAWIGPIPIQDGDYYLLPNLEIAPLGLTPLSPPDGVIFGAGSISPGNPLSFEWLPYPAGAWYWVELRAGPALQLVWQSGLINNPLVSFDGLLINGEPIQAGNYWWGVGVRLDDPLINIAGPLASFILRP